MTPIIISDTSPGPPPPPPDSATSPDGIITAAYIPGTNSSDYCRPFCRRYPCDSDAAESQPGGVYLLADFSGTFGAIPDPQFLDDEYWNPLRFPSFAHTDFTGAPTPTGTIRVSGYTDGDTDAELPGMRMWMIGEEPWSKTGTPPDSDYYPVTPGSSWYLAYDMQPDRAHPMRIQVSWQLTDGTLSSKIFTPVVNTTAGEWTTVSATVTAPDDAAGLAWAINVNTNPPDPLSFLLRNVVTTNTDLSPDGKRIDGVEFIRIDEDGTEHTVSGGDPATAVGGIAFTFDAEAPLGETSQWYAVPVYADGTKGPPSEPVALYLPWPDGELDCWLKPIHDLGSSIMAQILQPLPTFTYASRNQLSPVQGARLQAGGWDLHLAPEATFTFWTPDCVTRKQIIAALTQGPLLLQCHPDYQVADTYVLAGDITETPVETTFHDPGRVWTVPFTPVNRPATADTPVVPYGRTYADTHAAAGTYEIRYATWPTYADVALPIELPADSTIAQTLKGEP